MAFNEKYRGQAALLIRVLPYVAEEKCFALKGGTAINLFARDMPRLSVDIDLAYLPIQPRPESLAAIEAALKRVAQALKKGIEGIHVTETKTEGRVNKLLVSLRGVQIAVEVNPVMRGTAHPVETREVTETVEAELGYAEIQVVSFADLYGGKLVAALDRQHPRDFFDVRDLMANEGIDDAIRRAFIVYLLSHNRPMFEVLKANRKDITQHYQSAFVGMTEEEVPLDDLLTAREEMIADIVGKMPDAHKKFLVSFERGQPDWRLLGVEGAADLPAVKWRQQKLDELPAERRTALVKSLEEVLFG
jgi:predicted nucleotidyltransferase component of viral defense system